jgi:hypothetical protein
MLMITSNIVGCARSLSYGIKPALTTRNATSGLPHLIGIGGSLATPPLPHPRTYGPYTAVREVTLTRFDRGGLAQGPLDRQQAHDLPRGIWTNIPPKRPSKKFERRNTHERPSPSAPVCQSAPKFGSDSLLMQFERCLALRLRENQPPCSKHSSAPAWCRVVLLWRVRTTKEIRPLLRSGRPEALVCVHHAEPFPGVSIAGIGDA